MPQTDALHINIISHRRINSTSPILISILISYAGRPASLEPKEALPWPPHWPVPTGPVQHVHFLLKQLGLAFPSLQHKLLEGLLHASGPRAANRAHRTSAASSPWPLQGGSQLARCDDMFTGKNQPEMMMTMTLVGHHNQRPNTGCAVHGVCTRCQLHPCLSPRATPLHVHCHHPGGAPDNSMSPAGPSPGVLGCGDPSTCCVPEALGPLLSLHPSGTLGYGRVSHLPQNSAPHDPSLQQAALLPPTWM